MRLDPGDFGFDDDIRCLVLPRTNNSPGQRHRWTDYLQKYGRKAGRLVLSISSVRPQASAGDERSVQHDLNTILTDSEYNFVKLFNEALAENDDIGTVNGSPFDHGDN